MCIDKDIVDEYRGKTIKGEGKWVYGEISIREYGLFIVNSGDDVCGCDEDALREGIEILPITASLFINKYDVNQKKIYVRDIVNVKVSDTGQEMIGVICLDVYNYDEPLVYVHTESMKFNIEQIKEFEVIGNMIETPHLWG